MSTGDRRGGIALIPPIEPTAPTPNEANTQPFLKIIHQNVNGISADFNFNEVGLVLNQVQDKNVDILTMNELNVNLATKSVRSEYLKAYHSKHRQCSIQAAWAPTTIPANKYRPGGNQVSALGFESIGNNVANSA